MNQHKPHQKLLMLGLDAALPDLIAKFTEEGSMPVVKKLIERGWFSRMITTFPPLTAAAWGAITTGAGPGTAAVPSLMVHKPGEPLDKWHTSFCRHILEAETLWEAAGKTGNKTTMGCRFVRPFFNRCGEMQSNCGPSHSGSTAARKGLDKYSAAQRNPARDCH